MIGEQGRCADIYVFCLYPEKDKAMASVLNVPHWEFYVVLTEQINTVFGRQKRIALSRVNTLCQQPVAFDQLRERIDAVLKNGVCGESK